MQFNISMQKQVTGEDLRDILITAVEGAINYWAGPIDWIESDTVGYLDAIENFGKGEETFIIVEDDDPTVQYRVGAHRLADGLQRWVNYTGRTSLDPGDIDAGDADAILQFAIFGHLAYS